MIIVDGKIGQKIQIKVNFIFSLFQESVSISTEDIGEEFMLKVSAKKGEEKNQLLIN